MAGIAQAGRDLPGLIASETAVEPTQEMRHILHFRAPVGNLVGTCGLFAGSVAAEPDGAPDTGRDIG
jgi:hypothetical protein